MDKRYQVFVSSTYVDLVEERKIVFQTLMEMDCIPAGMELFPAADEEQFQFIKRVIDDCDYYLLIIGGRYGSLAEDQISYTEKEFDYAVAQGKKVVVLVHKNPDKIPAGKTEGNPKIRVKLEEFKKKAMTGRLVDFWEESKDLRGMVAVSLNKTIKMFPATGWVRGDKVASKEILEEVNVLRKENDNLKIRLETIKSELSIDTSKLVDFDDEHVIALSFTTGRASGEDIFGHEKYTGKNEIEIDVKISWREIFLMMGDAFLYEKSEFWCQYALTKNLAKAQEVPSDVEIVDSDISTASYNQIQTQFMAYGLIDSKVESKNGTQYLILRLTEKGKKMLLERRALSKT